MTLGKKEHLSSKGEESKKAVTRHFSAHSGRGSPRGDE